MIKNENGRSMVEMLGVLAIIGVLSVAGIAGYTMAMRKYRANEIAQAISMTAILIRSANGGDGLGTGASGTYANLAGTTTPRGVNGDITGKNTAGTFTVEATMDDNALCQAVQSVFGTDNKLPLYVANAGKCGEGAKLVVTVNNT